MNLLLKAKHWQLFLVTFVLPIIIIIYFMISLFSQLIPLIDSTSDNETISSLFSSMFNQFSWLPIAMLFIMLITYTWHWSVAINLQDKLPNNLKIDTTKYKLVFVFYILSSIMIPIGALWFIGDIFSNGFDVETFDNAKFQTFNGLLQLFQLAIMAGAFYLMYFAAKTIKTIELRREVKIGDFAVEMFFIWFFFIGVWILQPRINKIINNEIDPEADELLLDEQLIL